MRDLLAEDGSIYVHCDWRVNSLVRLVLDELFGTQNAVNEIVWKRTNVHSHAAQGTQHFARVQDTVFIFSKSEPRIWRQLYEEHSKEHIKSSYKNIEEGTGRRYSIGDLTVTDGGSKGNPRFEFLGVTRYWRYNKDKMEKLYAEGRIIQTSAGSVPRQKRYLDESPGVEVSSLWVDINPVASQSIERIDYPTQKPESLLERIIKASSNENDIVADFFCGSGTTLSVSEKLGRKWIGTDLGKFAIHTTRKRMIGVQRQLKEEGKDFRAFEILNLGKYERAHYIGINLSLREEEQRKQLEQKEKDFIALILKAYRAEALENFKCFHGKKAGRVVSVGPINLPVTRLFVEEVILECREKRISRADILAFEFEMGLFPNILDEAREKGIDLAMKYIPREVFDKRAVEKNQVVFHDVSYIEVKPHVKQADKRSKDSRPAIAVELTDFSVYYNQDTVDNAAAQLKQGKNKIVVEGGKIIKVSKDRDGIVKPEILTKKWTDWIDYWAVDFDFTSKREIIRVKNQATSRIEEQWTGEFIFENEWQSFRTKKDRSLELKTPFHECKPGRRKIAVKVVDIFGNDTMKIIEVGV
jgi:DNA modification methylase